MPDHPSLTGAARPPRHDGSASPAGARIGPPRQASRIVERQALLGQLMQARRRRCIVLQGAAGYGKTTTLAAWRQALMQLGTDVAWLTLSPDDNDPCHCLDDLLGSLAQVDPAITREAGLLGEPGSDAEAIERSVIALVRGIAQHPRDLVLVLDDLHHITGAGVQEALQWLLDYAPDNLHLALASRSAVPVSLARLRAQDLVLELDLRDLRFTPAESAAFLRAQLGGIDARSAEQLHQLTDGWVAGLQLLSVAWKRKRRSAQTPLSPKAITQVYVQNARAFANYFETEVLSGLAPAEMDLLVRASACNRFCVALGAALVGRPEANAEVFAALRRLEGDNLFLTQEEGATSHTWYRLHPLLREVLLERFSQLAPLAQRETHTAAWHWFRDHGFLDEAVSHALCAGEADDACELVERHIQELAGTKGLHKALALVRRLPPQHVRKRIGLRLWTARLQNYTRQLDACAATIEQLDADIAPDDADSRYTLMVIRCGLALQRDDPGGASRLLPQLLEVPENADALILGTRNNLLSWSYLHSGQYERARRVQLDAPPLIYKGAPLKGSSAGSLNGRCMVAYSHAIEGNMREAERVCRDVLNDIGQRGGLYAESACLANALLGEILFELNETETARDLLESQVELLERVSIPDSALRVLLVLADAHWVAGRQLDAFGCLEQLEEFALKRRLDRLLAHSLGQQAHRHWLLSAMTAAEEALARLDAVAARHPPTRDSVAAEIHVVAQRAHIRRCMVLEDHDGAMSRLTPLIALCETHGWQRLAAQLHLQAGVVAFQRGQADAMRQRVLAALRLGHRLGLVRSLIDSAPEALALIDQVAHDEALDPLLAFYVMQLKAAQGTIVPGMPNAPSPRDKDGLDEALSEREADVVRLLAQAMPNKKIASTLGLSRETVKWHLKKIYSKLGVTSRHDAVARVRHLQSAADDVDHP